MSRPLTYADLEPGDHVHLEWQGFCEYLETTDNGHDYCMAYTFRNATGKEFVIYQRPRDIAPICPPK